MSEKTFRQRKIEIEKEISLKDRQDISFVTAQISQMVRIARIQKGYTQKQLAEKIGKKQSSLARLEAGIYPPTISFLNEIAKALDTYLLIPKYHSINDYYLNDFTNCLPSDANSGVIYNDKNISSDFFKINLASF